MLGVVLPLLLVVLVLAALAYFRFRRRYTCRKQEEPVYIEPDNLTYSVVSDVPVSNCGFRQESGAKNGSCDDVSVRYSQLSKYKGQPCTIFTITLSYTVTVNNIEVHVHFAVSMSMTRNTTCHCACNSYVCHRPVAKQPA